MEILAITWVATAIVAFFVAAWLGKKLIPVLHRLKFGQTIREEGPAWHKSKQGTPTMGGIIFIAAMLITAVLAILVSQLFLPVKVIGPVHSTGDTTKLFVGLILAVGFGAIGFLDDFIKVVRKRNLGLTSKQKMAAQLLVSAAYAVTMYLTDATQMYVPFYGYWEAGIWFIPIAMFILVAMTNATNLTDGIDGLCASVSLVAFLFLLVLCGAATMGYGIVVSAMAGALAGFLVWNFHPARVFMGDTGSLFIGGVLCAVAFGLGHPLMLALLGIVYVAETLSVMLQVTYFKITHGKRLFKMSPLHHHFEMSGWSENKIVAVFCSVTVVAGALCLVLLFV